MKKGDILEGTVTKTLFPNKGIVYVYEKEEDPSTIQKIIVKNTLEGQKIRFLITKKKRSNIEGRLLEVL